jgi:hypothetical protein
VTVSFVDAPKRIKHTIKTIVYIIVAAVNRSTVQKFPSKGGVAGKRLRRSLLLPDGVVASLALRGNHPGAKRLRRTLYSPPLLWRGIFALNRKMADQKSSKMAVDYG